MQLQGKIEDSGIAPSFSCYSADSITYTAVAKVIREEEVARFQDIEDEDFEFSLTSSDEEVSAKEADSRGWTVFQRDLPPVKDEVDREIRAKDDEIDVSSAITSPLRKLFIGETDESSSYSSSDIDELESPTSVLKVGGRCKAQTPVHEQFYVQRRAENEVGKKKSYLPYRKDLLGLFANVNGMGKMLHL
ncbi:hypothetical protein L1987_71796 [Smallanthus sonchifolius]|uniref:Uncharacterized protein n=2 Tax=Smallanthus sonchifolius TaxID=185202 RepID=A0ACB9AUA3_9ASTR|nr:hypothetical protein L1987_71793 [Smallanthus sonchifolius]KAI3713223.1 hypothetical protein L1987_71796 [Smallanthus sonchifolius]